MKIHLHCFEYGRGQQHELKTYCESVSYYQRNCGLGSFSLKYPYIVKSRSNEDLLDTLLKDDSPILMEGVHCTFLLNDERFNNRKCYVRLHNLEHIYYRHLSKFSRSIIKKAYYWFESSLLKKYERSIAGKATFLSVTEKDADTFKGLGAKHVSFLPLFLPQWKIMTDAGKGVFCLYHGDLSVVENEKAARWLIDKVFYDLNIPFVVAGKNPSKALCKLIRSRSSTCLIANPGEQEMQDLIAKAHINVLPSYNMTGIKIKLLNALFNGRHCLVNQQTVNGSGLEAACCLADSPDEFKNAITELYDQPFCSQEVTFRSELLGRMFTNEQNAQRLVKLIWSE